ncbi:MAG: nucleotide disphospho-sugar-binding domain-containing protein [Pyrinomonadaceae bacterium]
MAKVVLATFGSLGDLHPKIALALELKRRGHDVSIAAMEFYREKIAMLGLGFYPMAPHLDPEDKDLGREMMDTKNGSQKILRELILPNLRRMFDDLTEAVEAADLLITGEIVYAAKSVVEKTGIKWITTSLAPVSFFSAYDPPVPPMAQWFRHLRFLGYGFHKNSNLFIRWAIRDWYKPYKDFRRELGLDESHDPIFEGKYSKLLHLAMFSKVLGKPQTDWPPATLQTGFCFYDGQNDLGTMPENLAEFLDAGEPPIVFTLGSAAVMDARDFFDISAQAAEKLNRRAVLLYGVFNEGPKGLDENIVGFDYAPYSLVFPRAACVVHQGGVGTTGQVLRAGVPHLIMPYGHDQPDNAVRCERAGLGEMIGRDDYNVKNAVAPLKKILADKSYSAKAFQASRIVEAERGTQTACDAIEDILRK